MSTEQLAAVVLAGGASRRMGREKGLLLLPDGRTALQAVLEAAHVVADRVLLAVDTPEHAEQLCATLPMPAPELLLDATPGAGPLAALAGAIYAVEAPALLLLAVDTPLLQPAVLRALHGALAVADPIAPDIALPVIGGVPQPMPACYATRLVTTIDHLLSAGRRDLRALIEAPDVCVHYVGVDMLRGLDPDLRSFAGANTPEEWDALLACLPSESAYLGR